MNGEETCEETRGETSGEKSEQKCEEKNEETMEKKSEEKFAGPWARACQIRSMLGKWYWSLDAGRLLIGK